MRSLGGESSAAMGREVDVARPRSGVVDIPCDQVVSPVKNLDLVRVIEGLVAVGVPVAEAILPHVGELGMEEAVRLAAGLGATGLERVNALFQLQEGFQDKKAFGRLCADHGIHPVSVALVGFGSTGKVVKWGLPEGSGDLVRRLIQAFDVDPWLAKSVDFEKGRICFFDGGLSRANPPLNFIPCSVETNVLVRKSRFPFLREVGGDLALAGPAGSLSALWVSSMEFPSLEYVGGAVDSFDLKEVHLDQLRGIGCGAALLNLKRLWAPRLEKVTGNFFMPKAREIHAPSLVEITGRVEDKKGALKLGASALRWVNNEEWRGTGVEP